MFETNYRHISDLVRQLAPASNIKLIVNEWNVFDGPTIQGMEGAVYASRMMNGFERDGDIVASNCISDLLNGWIGGIIQSSRDRIYGTAEYYAVKMYADHLGTDRLHSEIASRKLQNGVPAIDAVATRSLDGSKIFVKLSNADSVSAASTSTSVQLDNFKMRTKVDVDVLNAAPGTRNTFEQPNAIFPATMKLNCDRKCNVVVTPQSVMILTFYAK